MTKVSKKQKQSVSTEPAIDGYKVLYAVLKLSQEITYTDPFTREERKEDTRYCRLYSLLCNL